MSNATVVTATSESEGPMSNRFRMPCRKLTTDPCWTRTPFGLPVEPDV
jgi:hypothetical protein